MLAQLAIAGVDVLTDAYFFIVTLIKSAKSSKRKVGIQRFTNCLLNHVFKHNYISRSYFFLFFPWGYQRPQISGASILGNFARSKLGDEKCRAYKRTQAVRGISLGKVTCVCISKTPQCHLLYVGETIRAWNIKTTNHNSPLLSAGYHTFYISSAIHCDVVI